MTMEMSSSFPQWPSSCRQMAPMVAPTGITEAVLLRCSSFHYCHFEHLCLPALQCVLRLTCLHVHHAIYCTPFVAACSQQHPLCTLSPISCIIPTWPRSGWHARYTLTLKCCTGLLHHRRFWKGSRRIAGIKTCTRRVNSLKAASWQQPRATRLS